VRVQLRFGRLVAPQCADIGRSDGLEPDHFVNDRLRERSLQVDGVTNGWWSGVLRNEQHGGVHMRGFEHVDALPIEVEWTSSIGKWVYPVGAPRSHHHKVTVFDDVSLSVSGVLAGSDRSKINDICR
jgi:hypothetical protein